MPCWHTLIILICISVAACEGGSGEGLSNNGRPLDEVASIVPLAATLESLQANLFTPNCAVSGCHTGTSAPLGLVLDDGKSFANLVATASVQQPAIQRVKAGDSSNSYLLQKVEGLAGISGSRMPKDRARLNQNLIDTLKQWIDNGAQATTGSLSPLPAPLISFSSVANNAIINALPNNINITFSTAMDASTLVALTLELLATGGDGDFGNGNESTLIVQPALSVDGRNLNLDLSANANAGVANLEESYRFTIKGSGPAVARDSNSQVIDGDRDGFAGGDFVVIFSVAAGLQASFSSLEKNFFVPNCAKSGCHFGASPAAGMNLELGNVFASIVNVQSRFDPLLKRIKPGDADNSAIVQALEGTTLRIPQMPFDNPGSIPQADIDILRQWINDGANP